MIQVNVLLRCQNRIYNNFVFLSQSLGYTLGGENLKAKLYLNFTCARNFPLWFSKAYCILRNETKRNE